MTKLEAIAFFMDMDECTYGGSEPIQMAIEALKQETVSREVYDHEYALRKEFETKAYKLQRRLERVEHNIDKIKAEIEQTEINGHIRDIECFRAGINVALNVIDKYKVGEEYENN